MSIGDFEKAVVELEKAKKACPTPITKTQSGGVDKPIVARNYRPMVGEND